MTSNTSLSVHIHRPHRDGLSSSTDLPDGKPETPEENNLQKDVGFSKQGRDGSPGEGAVSDFQKKKCARDFRNFGIIRSPCSLDFRGRGDSGVPDRYASWRAKPCCCRFARMNSARGRALGTRSQIGVGRAKPTRGNVVQMCV